MSVLLEGRVCKHILSYTSLQYLFTGTVCRAWKDNCADSVCTDIATAFESPSRIREAVRTGVSCMCSDKEAGVPSCDFFMEYAEIVDADVEVFKAIHEMGYDWGEFTMQNAAIGNKIEIVKFMHQHGCQLTSGVLFNAANNNCLDLVRYLAENNCPIDSTPIETEDTADIHFNTRSLEQAISQNYHDVVVCLRSEMNFPFDHSTFRVACKADYPKNIRTLEYLHAEGCAHSSFLIYDMINDGNFHAVEFMLRHNLHENKHATAMCIAVSSFRANIMRLLVEYDFEVNSDVVDLATYDIGLVKWLTRVGGKDNHGPTPRAYLNTIECDLDETHCVETLDWLLHHWKLAVPFESFAALEKSQRWTQALHQRDTGVTEWFRDNIASIASASSV